jgi:hypothetical protein
LGPIQSLLCMKLTLNISFLRSYLQRIYAWHKLLDIIQDTEMQLNHFLVWWTFNKIQDQITYGLCSDTYVWCGDLCNTRMNIKGELKNICISHWCTSSSHGWDWLQGTDCSVKWSLSLQSEVHFRRWSWRQCQNLLTFTLDRRQTVDTGLFALYSKTRESEQAVYCTDYLCLLCICCVTITVYLSVISTALLKF